MDHAALAARVRALADAHAACSLGTIGASREGRELFLLTLAADPATAQRKPALLIAAGLDGRHWVGAETAVRVVERILTEHGALLEEMTVYVLPRMNPDGAELNFGSVNSGHVGTLRPVDTDRDGSIDEDGPNDLNNDGVITMMRRVNPPVSDPPTHLPDPHEPRLMKTPDWTKGERATHSLHIEGLDEDGDGTIAEDGAGAVDLDRNLMHLWPEFARDAGPHQLSEPESLALAKFVLERRNIGAAIVYGRHDNMINVPDHRERDINRQVVKGIDEGDKALYDELSKLFKDTTGQKRAPKEDAAGAFFAWLYAQRGVVSAATVVWGRPDVDEKKDEQDGDGAGDAANNGDARKTDIVAGAFAGSIDLSALAAGEEGVPQSLDITLELTPEGDTVVGGRASSMMGEIALRGEREPGSPSFTLVGDMGGAPLMFAVVVEGDALTAQISGPVAAPLSLRATRVGGGDAAPAARAPSGAKKKDGPADAEEAAWLKYSDSRGGVGFVAWSSFDHPTLGAVEIGGWVPGFRMNPPADELDALAEKHAAFVAALMEKRARLRLEGPQVKRLAPGLYDVRIAVVNDGWLPTTTAMGERARAALPTVLRLSTPLDQIVSGERVGRAWRIEGFARRTFQWILAVEDGAPIEIELLDDRLGDSLIRFHASEDATFNVAPLPEDRR